MDEAREKHLVDQIRTLRCTEEITGFRQQMREQGEEPTTAIFKALIDQQTRVGQK
jgi:DNA-binding GntR family transcriptional regulator